MLLKVDFPTCLTVTMLTTIYNSFMHIFLMFLGCFYELPYSHIAHNYILLLHAQILHVVGCSLFESLLVTKITTIYNSFMNRFHMLLKEDFLSCLIVTMLTTIFYSLVHRFHMLLKVTFLIFLIVALLTIIFYSFM